MTEKQFLLAYDRKRTSTLTLDSEPGAHTGNTRQYIPGYSDSNIVFLDTVSGNDANSGASEVLAKLTYASAATAAGTTKKIRVINNGAALSTNITKPTEMKRGVSGTISSSLTAPVNTWTQSTTLNGYTGTQNGIAWVPWLSLFIATGGTSKLYSSPDAVTWTAIAGHGFGSDSPSSICISQKNKLVFIAGAGKIGYSSDGLNFTVSSAGTSPVTSYSCIHFDEDTETLLAVGSYGTVTKSVDLGVSFDSQVLELVPVFYGVTKSETRWVIASASDEVYYSDDANTWTRVATSAGAVWLNIFYSRVAGKFLLGDESGLIYNSSNGTTWAAAATPSFGASNVYGFSESIELSKIIAVGAGGKLAYSSDADTFTQAGTISFGASDIYGVGYSPLLNKFCAAGASNKAAYSTAFANTISANVAGFTIQAVQYSGTISAYNCTMKQPGTTANLSLNACRVTEAGSHISSNTAGSFATLFEGDRHTTCTPATQNAIDCNLDTVGGTWYIYNASATGFERVRDCLVTDGIIANFNVTVGGRANIQGDSENILIDAEVTTDDPKFVDTTDYKLQFQTNGYARNSLAAGRSAIYFNSAGSPRDIGAWSYVESAISYYFAKSAVLYKGQITHATERVTTEQQGDSGVITVFGNKHRVKEILTIEYGPTKELDRAPFEYLDTIDDKGVKLIIDAEWESNAGTVTVNGNQSADSEFLTVDSCIYYNGMWVTVAGKRYWIMRASPSNTAATKLILDRSLEDAVTDNQVLVTNYPPGVGEFQYSGIQQIQLKRIAPDGLVGWQTGFQIRLVRKKQ